MSIHKIEMPTEVFYGPDSLSRVGDTSKKFGKKVLLISDNIIEKMGYVKTVTRYLEEEGLTVYPYLGANSEPTDTYVDEALDILKENNCDVIVTIGGGSCLDTAKAVAVVATNGGYIGDYMKGNKIADVDPIPLVTIPTTAGTGSEVTNVTVITNTKENIKMMIKQTAFLPKVAIVDPNLTMTAPNKVTAATGMDALCHAIESYVSQIAHPMTRTFSLEAIRLILNNIQTVYDNGDDVEARSNMSLAAMEAGIAFSNASVTLVHGMSRPIGALFHVPHGVSNSMLLPAVLEFSKQDALNELADIAKLFLSEDQVDGKSIEELADETIRKVKELSHHLNIPNLKSWGIDENEFEASLDKMATDALNSGSPSYNPRVPSHDEIKELYRTCFSYDYSK
ncbi:iron-containing alcohol dehydrogenase [Alkalibacterium psychrotolerans]